MAGRDDGGPAFARPAAEHSHACNYEQEGMSLRDYFAGQALMGLVAFDRPVNGDNQPEHFARWSYALADAMLAARKKES
jgi:hypothetical protein